MKRNKENLNTVIDILMNYGLRTICSFVQDIDKYQDEIEGIRTLYQIDILNPNSVENLTDTEIELLKHYEIYLVASGNMSKDEIFNLVRTITYFACMFLLMCFAYLMCLTWIPVPEDNVRFADTTLGFILGTVVVSILNFLLSVVNIDIFKKNSPNNKKEIKSNTPAPPPPPSNRKCPLEKSESYEEEEPHSSE